jgi:uncharacterized protein YprB with RNaseH-like and TPR domain
MLTEVFFDVETKHIFDDIGVDDPAKLGVSVVSTYYRILDDNFKEIEGKLNSFWEEDFGKMWKLFQESDRVIGFNSLNFDIPALQPYAFFNLSTLPHFDIMDKVKEKLGHRISLASLASESLGKNKTDSGINAVLYWKEGGKENLEKLKKYCEADVILTKELYDFGLLNKYLKYRNKWNTLKIVDVDFSYQDDNKRIKQVGLF